MKELTDLLKNQWGLYNILTVITMQRVHVLNINPGIMHSLLCLLSIKLTGMKKPGIFH